MDISVSYTLLEISTFLKSLLLEIGRSTKLILGETGGLYSIFRGDLKRKELNNNNNNNTNRERERERERES